MRNDDFSPYDFSPVDNVMIDAYGFSGGDMFGLEEMGNTDIGETTGNWARRVSVKYVTPYQYPFTAPVFSD